LSDDEKARTKQCPIQPKQSEELINDKSPPQKPDPGPA
jgi:hypothetical protein